MKNYRDMTLCMETQEPSKTEFCNPAFEPEAGLPSLPVSLGEAGTTPDTCWDGRPHWRHQPDCRFSWLCTGLLSALLLLLLGLLAAIILAQLKSPSPDGVGLPSLAPAYGQANTTVVTIPTAPSDSDARGELGTTPMPQPGCGGLLTDPEGTFSSPNYPSPYPRNAHCVWLIQVAPDRVVQLKVETLSMEALTSCLFDRLEISPEAEEPHLLGGPVVRMCGQVAPATLNTNTSRIRATFVSDGSVEASGFRAWYRAVVPGEGGCAQGEFACDQLLCLLPTSVCDGTFNCADRSDEANCSSKFVDCGGTLTELQGSFHSPNYPQPYPPTQICLWKISVPAGHIIELKFNNFSLEAEDHCHYDFVEVYDNVGIHSSGFLGRFCGTQQPPPLTSSRHVLTVLFVADDGLGGCGFSATYQTLKATEKTCGSDQFSCHDGACQDAQWVCDGWKDCADGSDEFNCSSYRSYRPLESVCEPIQVEVCQDLSYNGTAFPSVWMSLPDQQGAVNVLRDFTSLADLACYQPFRRFLCGLYVPRCVPGEGVLPPCRPVCQEAEWHCQPTLELLGLPWPFNCNVLPEATDPTQCSQPAPSRSLSVSPSSLSPPWPGAGRHHEIFSQLFSRPGALGGREPGFLWSWGGEERVGRRKGSLSRNCGISGGIGGIGGGGRAASAGGGGEGDRGAGAAGAETRGVPARPSPAQPIGLEPIGAPLASNEAAAAPPPPAAGGPGVRLGPARRQQDPQPVPRPPRPSRSPRAPRQPRPPGPRRPRRPRRGSRGSGAEGRGRPPRAARPARRGGCAGRGGPERGGGARGRVCGAPAFCLQRQAVREPGAPVPRRPPALRPGAGQRAGALRRRQREVHLPRARPLLLRRARHRLPRQPAVRPGQERTVRSLLLPVLRGVAQARLAVGRGPGEAGTRGPGLGAGGRRRLRGHLCQRQDGQHLHRLPGLLRLAQLARLRLMRLPAPRRGRVGGLGAGSGRPGGPPGCPTVQIGAVGAAGAGGGQLAPAAKRPV